MKLVSLDAALFLIIRYELFHLCYAFPQTISNNLNVPSRLYPTRNKRSMEDSIRDIGQSIMNFGATLIQNASLIGDANEEYIHSIIKEELSSTPANNVVFVMATESPKPTEIPFDWPAFYLQFLDLVKTSLREFSANIQCEVNKLSNATDGGIADSIMMSVKGLERIGTKMEDISVQMGGVIKSIDDVNQNINTASKSIGNTIESGAKSIENGLVRGSKTIEQSLQKVSQSIEKSLESGLSLIESYLEKNSKTNQESLENGMKLIEKAMKSAIQSIEKSLKDASKSIDKSLGEALDDSMTHGMEIIDKAIKEVSPILDSFSNFLDTVPAEFFERYGNMLDQIASINHYSQTFDTIHELLDNLKDGESNEETSEGAASKRKDEAKPDGPISTVIPDKDPGKPDGVVANKLLIPGVAAAMGKRKHVRVGANKPLIPDKDKAKPDKIVVNKPIIPGKDKRKPDRVGANKPVISDKKLDSNYEQSKIATNVKLMNLGTQIEMLGAAFEDSVTTMTGLRTAQVFKNIGSLMKSIPKNL